MRSDAADYYFEVQRFDTLAGAKMAPLERIDELDNTIIVMTGDHGMPYLKAKDPAIPGDSFQEGRPSCTPRPPASSEDSAGVLSAMLPTKSSSRLLPD